VQGKEVSLAQAPVTGSKANVIDLMAALKASLNAREKKPTETKERKAPKRAPAAAPRKAGRR
jgi:non-homologous end joining protein Ku